MLIVVSLFLLGTWVIYNKIKTFLEFMESESLSPSESWCRQVGSQDPGEGGVLQGQLRGSLALHRLETKCEPGGRETRVYRRYRENVDIDRTSRRPGKEGRILSLLEVLGFYWGLWSNVCVFSGIQELVRTRTWVQVTFIDHLFLKDRGSWHWDV